MAGSPFSDSLRFSTAAVGGVHAYSWLAWLVSLNRHRRWGSHDCPPGAGLPDGRDGDDHPGRAIDFHVIALWLAQRRAELQSSSRGGATLLRVQLGLFVGLQLQGIALVGGGDQEAHHRVEVLRDRRDLRH